MRISDWSSDVCSSDLALNHKSVSLVASLPWLKGLLLTAALSLPWYILAEIKTPGFLDYFIVGEHFRRFLDPGWTGDLYGTAHKQAYGTIWYYWLQASFPWGVLTLIAALGALRRTRLSSALRARSEESGGGKEGVSACRDRWAAC